MSAFAYIAPWAAGICSLVGASLMAPVPASSRPQWQSAPASDAQVWVSVPSRATFEAATQAPSTRPTGDDSFRPSHFTVASVIVTLERSRSICLSRIGGLYGP
jgi:hypothetical protein